MTQLVISSKDEAMRAILTLIGQEHALAVTTYQDPMEAVRAMEMSTTPLIALFDVWLDRWDDEAQVRLAHYPQISARHAAIVLWDAHIALPPNVRAEFAAQRIVVVKKPLELVLLDAALNAAVRQVSETPEVPPFSNDTPSPSLP